MISIVLACAALALIAVASGAQLAPLLAHAKRLDPRARVAVRESRLALPSLVDAVAAALRSGLSIQQALAEVAPTLPPPLAAATRRAAARLALGDRTDVALASFADAVASEEAMPFVIVLGAFARTGGRVGRSLARVAALLRGRIALEDERRALTAQGRASAIVLVALAPLGAVFFAVMTPEYFAVLLDRGRWLFVLAIVLELLGALWLTRILRATSGRADFATLLDAVVVGLDAGLTFRLAVAQLIARAPRLGRVAEARRLLADLALGQRPRDAFASFGAAGPTEARVAALVMAATRFGAPLAELLVAQADALRTSERRRAEAQARRLPILMLFPLAFCILPALLIVFLGPPLLSLVR